MVNRLILAFAAAAALGALTTPFDGAADPAAVARNPTSGIASAAIATTSTAMKTALFMFIVLSLSNPFGNSRSKSPSPTTPPDAKPGSTRYSDILRYSWRFSPLLQPLIPGAPLVLVVSNTAPLGANRLSDGFSFPVLLKLKVLVVPWALP